MASRFLDSEAIVFFYNIRLANFGQSMIKVVEAYINSGSMFLTGTWLRNLEGKREPNFYDVRHATIKTYLFDIEGQHPEKVF